VRDVRYGSRAVPDGSGATPGTLRYVGIPSHARSSVSRTRAHAPRDWSRPAAAPLRDPRLSVAGGLADAFLAGEWDPPAMTRRGERAVGQRRVWIRDLALAARHAYPQAPLDAPRELAWFLAACAPLRHAFSSAIERSEPVPTVRRRFVARTAMGVARWPVMPLHSVRDLQDLLGLGLGELMWLADPRQLERTVRDEQLRHYRYRWAAKSNGGVRLIEEPKPLLKHVQRVLNREVLDHIPPHDAAHGFRAGRSAITYASTHAGHAVVIHLDLEDFFGTITAGRVFGIYRSCGYPERVAHLLAALTTNSIPVSVWTPRSRPPSPLLADAHFRLGQHLRHPHLPQGAPTSPALANLSAYRLDLRLAGLAQTAGIVYSRYADDLALSSSTHLTRSRVERLVSLVERIATEEGFKVNPFKTFFQRASQRQRLAGLVVNHRPNVDRREYDQLKAVLHNAARYGPHTQNRKNHPNFQAHLLGRISRINHLNPHRGERLLATFSQIDWAL
jgi:RNA-directed DNA polymerase